MAWACLSTEARSRLDRQAAESNISSLCFKVLPIPAWCIAPPGSACESPPARRPLLRAAALGRRRLGMAAGHQPASPAAGCLAGCRLPGAVPPAHRHGGLWGTVGDRGTVGPAALRRRLVQGGQAASERRTGRVPETEARPGPGQVLLRHLPSSKTDGYGCQWPRVVPSCGYAWSAPSPTQPSRSGRSRCWPTAAGYGWRSPPASPSTSTSLTRTGPLGSTWASSTPTPS